MVFLNNRNIELIILNGISLAVYIFVFFNLNITVSNEIAFSTSDSKTYFDVVNWLVHGIDSESVSTRPILYPLILLIVTKIGGVYGIWILQTIFWLFTINFIFLTIKKLTRSSIPAFIGTLVFISNLSVIALTLHALTEVTSIFLLSMMIFFLTKNLKRYKEPKFLHICLFFLVLLTIIKPTFSIPLYCILFIVFPLFYLKKHLKHPMLFFKLLLIFLPLIFQLTIMKTKYDQLTVSTIGHKTFTKYLVAQGVQEIESMDREDSQKAAMSFSREEEIDYVFEHLPIYKRLYWSNLLENIGGRSTYLLFPVGYENHQLAKFMATYNRLTVRLHVVFIFLLLPLLVIFIKRKMYPQLLLFGSFYLLGLYYILVTGISFWQGDRLTLVSIAIWACLYPTIICYYLSIFHPKMSIPK